MREKLSQYKVCDGCGWVSDCLPAGHDRWECEPCEGATSNARKRKRQLDPNLQPKEYPDMSEYQSRPEPNPEE